MSLYLMRPASDAHLDDLRARLAARLGSGHPTAGRSDRDPDLVESLVEVVRAMDQGLVTPGEALEAFARRGIHDFGKWLVDMLDGDVYRDTRFDRTSQAHLDVA